MRVKRTSVDSSLQQLVENVESKNIRYPDDDATVRSVIEISTRIIQSVDIISNKSITYPKNTAKFKPRMVTPKNAVFEIPFDDILAESSRNQGWA